MDSKPLLYGIVALLAVIFVLKLGNVITGYASAEADQNITREGNLSIINAAPTVGTVTCTFTSPRGPCQNGTVLCWATATDQNGDQDLDAANGTFYLSGTACTTEDPNNCYINGSCTIDKNAGTALEANITCTFNNTRFYIEPGSWNATIWVNDGHDTGVNDNHVMDISDMIAINITNTILNFGSLAVGETSSYVTTEAHNCGNVQINVTINATDLTCYGDNGECTAGSDKILVGNMTFNTTDVGTVTLSYTKQLALKFFDKEIDDNFADSQKPISFKVQIPEGTKTGTYNNTIAFWSIKAQ